MKKFVFSLQALLHLKLSIEKQEKSNLAAATRKMNALVSEREGMVARRDEASALYGAKLAEGMLASETHRFTSYFRMMKDALEEQDGKIRQAQGELDACRQRLVEIMREIHMLNTLRDKQYQQYLQEVQSENDRAIGDFVSYQTTNRPAD